jgi:hypothetical protein
MSAAPVPQEVEDLLAGNTETAPEQTEETPEPTTETPSTEQPETAPEGLLAEPSAQ